MKVTVNGKKVSAQSIIFRHTVADAVKGNHKARQQVVDWLRAFNLLGPDDGGDAAQGLAQEDWDILRRHFGDDFANDEVRGGEAEEDPGDGEAGDEEKAA